MNFLKMILVFATTVCMAQANYNIKGHFESTANKEIVLKGFTSEAAFILNKTTIDSNGNFIINYPADYVGAALLDINNGKKLIVLLNHENFEIQWDDLNTTKSLKFTNSVENTTFDYGLSLYQNTNEKKVGISYLLPYYENDNVKRTFFKNELAQLNQAIPDYMNGLSVKLYASYYLKIRVLMADYATSIKRNPKGIPALEQTFNQINFADERLIHSGLYYELLETHVVAMEYYGEKATQQLNQSTDKILASLKSKPELKQNVAEYLFNLFEKRSLFESSEHIALAMLNDDTCQLDDKHKALFEQYRKMANGKTAPNIELLAAKTVNLYNLKSNYKLVVFGASWCSKCVEEIPKLKAFYADWKKKHNIEIIFVSLDTDKNEYANFTKDFPWLSSCDFFFFLTKAARDYCVFATPTIYLLDANNTIKIKPISADQVNAWLDLHP